MCGAFVWFYGFIIWKQGRWRHTNFEKVGTCCWTIVFHPSILEKTTVLSRIWSQGPLFTIKSLDFPAINNSTRGKTYMMDTWLLEVWPELAFSLKNCLDVLIFWGTEKRRLLSATLNIACCLTSHAVFPSLFYFLRNLWSLRRRTPWGYQTVLLV